MKKEIEMHMPLTLTNTINKSEKPVPDIPNIDK